MNKVTDRLIKWAIKKDIIEVDERELYEYAIFSILIHIIPIIITAILGVVIGNPVEGLVFIISFMGLRKFAGGYHAGSLSLCLTESIILIAIILMVLDNLKEIKYIDWITVIVAIVIAILSPIESDNKPIYPIEAKIYKFITIGLLLINIVFAEVMKIVGRGQFFNYIFSSVAIICLLQIIGIIKINYK